MFDLITTSDDCHDLAIADIKERIEELASKAQRPNTRKAYDSSWRVWIAWAERHGVTALPAEPSSVAAFLADQSRSKKLNTIKSYLAAISVRHSRADEDFDRHDRSIRVVLAGLREEKGDDVRRVEALTVDRLQAMSFGDDIAGLRDKALLYLGVASGCRRSELAGLDLMERGTGTGVIRREPDGIVLVLHQTKTGRGVPQEVAVRNGAATEAVEAWIAAAGIEAGTPLFRAVRQGGTVHTTRLTGRSIARIVKRRCSAAGLDPAQYSGHSLRAGMITSAAEAGIERDKIKRHSRHKSDAMVESYIRIADRFGRSISKEIGL